MAVTHPHVDAAESFEPDSDVELAPVAPLA